MRGSCAAAVTRVGNREHGNYADRAFGRVYVEDPARSAMRQKGVPSRGVTVAAIKRALK